MAVSDTRARGPRAPSGQGPDKRKARPAAKPEGRHPRIFQSLLAVLEQLMANELPADMVLRRHFKDNEWLGRRDRGLIADTAFDILRNRRLYSHLAQGTSGPMNRRLALISLEQQARQGLQPWARAGIELIPAEREWLDHVASIDPLTLAPAVRFSLPDWLFAELRTTLLGQVGAADEAPLDARLADLAKALLVPAPLDLRVNALLATPAEVITSLAADGVEAHELSALPGALRVRGKPALERTLAFNKGWIEVQDVGSQLLALVVAPRRGQTVVDFCAGAGGKTLALASLMRSTGQIYACDVSASRLQRFKPRLARSGATNVQPFAIDTENDPKLARLASRADCVLVDAPCSGTGTLRRNPDLKWRVQPGDLAGLAARQSSILAAAARLVKPGGALIYATCSLLARENEAVAAAFEAAHPAFEPDSELQALLTRQQVGLTGLATDRPDGRLHLRPGVHDCDGFFVARWLRKRANG